MVDESKCLDIPIWEFSIILDHLPFLTGYKPILRLLLVHRNQAIWRWYPWFWRLSFERCWRSLFSEYCVRPRIVFYNVASEYNSTFAFLVLWLQFGILQMTDVHQWGKMNFCAFRPCFIDHLWFTSDFWSGPTPESFLVSHILYPLLPLLREFSWLDA